MAAAVVAAVSNEAQAKGRTDSRRVGGSGRSGKGPLAHSWPQERGQYEFAETEARARGVGLWNDAQPVPPWDWRKGAR